MKRLIKHPVFDVLRAFRELLLLEAFLMAVSLLGHAQQLQTVVIQPDCVININFTAVGQTTPTSPNAGFNNITGGCTTWTMQIAVQGFTGTPTVALESAPNTAGQVPGTYVTFAGGTIISPSPNNVNPIVTTTTGFLWEVGPAAWVRAHFVSATGTGTVTGVLLGYRTPGASANGAGGSVTANVNLVQVGGASIALGQTTMSASIPVAIASNQSTVGVQGGAAAGAAIAGNPLQTGGKDGSGNVQYFATDTAGGQYDWSGCDSQAIVTLSGTGYNSIVTGTGGQVIRVCNFAVTSASGGTPNVNTFSLAFGTCGSSPTEAVNISGVTGYTDQFFGSLRGAAAAAFCVSESVANGDKVAVTFKKAAF